MERTAILASAAFVLSLPVSLALGVFTARRWGRPSDLTTSFLLVVINSLPEFVVGIGLLIVFSVVLGVLPPDSSGVSFGGFGAQVQAYLLPVLTLVLVSIPYIARVTRAAAREALAAPYTRAAALRGLSRRTVIWDHAMRNAGPPVVNAVAINAVYLIGGVIVVENLFGFPGAGQDLVQAIDHGDAATVQAIALLMGAMFIAISLLADTIVIYFNPRLKAAER
jgi:peptide/nickel transport system permease protein